MKKRDQHEENEQGLDQARRLAEEDEGIGRKPTGFGRHVVPFIAVCWCLFQLSIASWLIIDHLFARAIHLGFALLIVYLNYPMFKERRRGLKFLAIKDRIPVWDYAIGIFAAFCAVYIMVDYVGLTGRYGRPITRDIVLGLALVFLLLEATRRVIGPALPIIATVFCVYSFAGPYMPDVLAFKGVSLNRFIGQMSMSTEGIYGIPLDVSATIVFLYVLFGAMLEKAGAGMYFIRLALSMLGRFKGGPAKAAVVASGLTGMVSGSSIANVVTTGTFTIPLMKRVGYPARKAAAIEVAASTDGQLAPPIMGAAAFIIAEYCNMPYIEVMKAAAIPAFASYAALFFITHVEASKLGLQGMPREELPPFFKTVVSGLHFLLPLVFLLYQLIILRHSPEAAAFNAIWVLAIIMLAQHPVVAFFKKEPLIPAFKQGVVDIFAAFASGGRNMVSVALATAASGVIVGVVALGLGGLITQVIDKLSMGNIYLMLFITAFASLLLGMGLPTTATYIVMASLTAPAIVKIGAKYDFMVPLIAAHLFCFFYGILADDTPPVGLAAYAASAIAKSDPIRTGIQGFMYDIRTGVLPFFFIFNTDLVLDGITSIPLALLIFLMACLGNFAFVGATQGWFIAKNRSYEIPLLLAITAVMMRPYGVGKWFGVPYEQRHLMYVVGLVLLGIIILMQRPRIPKAEVAPTTP